MPSTMPRRLLGWLIVAVVALAALAVAGPFVYIHLFSSTPAALALTPSSPSSSSSGGTAAAAAAAGRPVAGTWVAGAGSVVGYRVHEVLLGQGATAVGRSTSVTGHLVISGTAVTAASFSVPMDTVHSDRSGRDAQFDGRIMDVARYPAGTFTLTREIGLAPVPAAGVIRSYTAHGRLTLHGITRAVTFTLTAERKGARIEAAGRLPVLFADYGIANPSLAGFVTTQDHGVLEFLLVFSKTS